MKKDIYLLDVLRILDEKAKPDGTPITHSIAFIKYSEKGSGKGEICRMKSVVQCGLKNGRADKMMRAVRSTISNEIKQFHIRLLIEIDGLKIIWS